MRTRARQPRADGRTMWSKSSRPGRAARWLTLAGTIGLTSVSSAQDDPAAPVEVMLLATYHFNNPGADRFNLEVDDYFSDRRQDEIADVVDRLAEFAPDRIFVERMPDRQAALDETYASYRSDELELNKIRGGRSELYQLGFRLAKQLDLGGVSCVDAQGLWLGSRVESTATDQKLDFYARYIQQTEQMIAAESELLSRRTVLEALVETNRPEAIMENHFFYSAISPLVVDPSREPGVEYLRTEENGQESLTTEIDPHLIGAELTAEWYKRNIRIYSNVLRHVNEDDERILIIFGQGHIRILQHLFEDHPGFECVAPNDFLE